MLEKIAVVVGSGGAVAIAIAIAIAIWVLAVIVFLIIIFSFPMDIYYAFLCCSSEHKQNNASDPLRRFEG